MPADSLTATVTRVLRQPALARLGFNLNGLIVTGDRYGAVARAIDRGDIKCVAVDSFAAQGKDELAAGTAVEARYSADANAMKFQRADYGANSVHEERTILHEATHAIFDLYASSKNARVLSIDDESAAVLAEAFYIRLVSQKVGGFKMMADGPGEPALALADEVLRATDGFADRQVAVLTPTQTEDLRAAVARQWNFVRTVEPGGIISDRSTAVYIYNGVVKCVSCLETGR